MCTVDALFVMYMIGGSMLGYLGMKSYKKYVAKKKTDGAPGAVGDEETLSTHQ